MDKRQRLTLQVLEEDHLEEDDSDSDEYSPELDEGVPNEVTDTRNELVRST